MGTAEIVLRSEKCVPEPLLTADEVAEWLQVERDVVYELPLPRIRISENRVRFRPADVREFLEERESVPGKEASGR